MKPDEYDPVERARQKQRSRAKDDEDIRTGRVSREEMQRRNGGGGLFRNARITGRKPYTGSHLLQYPDSEEDDPETD